MEEEKVERKLAAILHADVVGYSRLMGQDEVGTHRSVVASLDEITSLIESYAGTVVNFAGDAVLAEFASAVDALACAVEIQRHSKVWQEGQSDNRKLSFRIGLNLGDVIVSEGNIHGDGVNVAARLEGLAEPDGICISGSVLEQVKNKLGFGYESLGKQKLKNITEPVQVYRVIQEPTTAGMVIGNEKERLGGWQWAAIAVAIVAITGAGALTIWNSYPRPSATDLKAASRIAERSELPAKPSIAVLPFKHISDDSGQDYFSDGITEDIITDLSKFRGLFVIASNTVFTYKGKPVNVQDVSRDLRVRYVLEGSVQKSGNRVRINAQLIDGTTGHHVWAERFIRDMKDLFALQDEIVRTIVATLAIKVDDAERERAMRKATDNLEAYDLVLRGREHCARTKRAANAKARKLIRQAINLDLRYGPAYAALGWCYMDTVRYGWTATPSQTLEQTHDLAQKALSLDEQNASAHRLLGTTYYRWQKLDLASGEFNRALKLNPNDADTYDALGAVRLYEGRPDAAIEAFETALRFNPKLGPSGLTHLGLAYYLKGQYGDAIETLERALGRNPNLAILHVVLAAAYSRANRAEDAARSVANVRRLHPFFKVDEFGNAFRKTSDRSDIRDGLRQAGLK